MLNIYLDTALLSAPNYATGYTPPAAQDLINRVCHFSDILIYNLPVKIIISDDADNVLDTYWPHIENIKDFLNYEGLSGVFDHNDLYSQYITILERSERPNQLNTFEVTSHANFTTVPTLPAGLGPDRFRVETERVLTTLATQQNQSTIWFMGSGIPGSSNTIYQVSSDVISCSKDQCPVHGAPTFTVSYDVQTLENLNSLIDTSIASQLWQSAQNAEDLHFAISLGALAIRRTRFADASIKDIVDFSIGSEFYASLQANQCAKNHKYSGVTFDLCCQIISNLGQVKIGIMGRPTQKQRPRDNARGHRTHITKSGIALRLLHWNIKGHLELANVGPKHQLIIENGAENNQSTSRINMLLE